MKDKKVSLKSLEKMLRNHYGYDNDEALSYLRRTGQVFINGQKYIVSEKEKTIANIGKQNYRDMRKNARKRR